MINQRIYLLILIPITVWCQPLFAADDSAGIPYGTPFAVPVLVSAKTASAMAMVGDSPSGAGPTMTVFYVQADGSLGCVAYTLTRQSAPTPNPTPNPQPNPSPNPVPVPGLLHVLVVYDNGSLAALPAAQAAIIDSMVVRDYLNSHCSKSGATAEYRFFDRSADLSKEPADWQTVAARPRSTLPWIVITNGKDTFEGPLPGTVEDTLTLLKKYGGL
jgi:hypothetical protein